MKLGVVKRINKEDLSGGGDLPGWVDMLLGSINQVIEPVVSALQGRLTFADNFSCKTVELTFTSGVALKVNSKSSLKVLGVLPVLVNGKTLDKWAMAVNGDSTVSLTLTFAEGGSAFCRLFLLLG